MKQGEVVVHKARAVSLPWSEWFSPCVCVCVCVCGCFSLLYVENSTWLAEIWYRAWQNLPLMKVGQRIVFTKCLRGEVRVVEGGGECETWFAVVLGVFQRPRHTIALVSSVWLPTVEFKEIQHLWCDVIWCILLHKTSKNKTRKCNRERRSHFMQLHLSFFPSPLTLG